MFGITGTEWNSLVAEQLDPMVAASARSVPERGISVAVLPTTGRDVFSGPSDPTFYGGMSRESYFEPSHELGRQFRSKWQERFIDRLGQDFVVVTRTPDDLRVLLDEADFSLLEAVDTSTAVRFGQLLGARVVVLPETHFTIQAVREGMNATVWGESRFGVRVLDVETGQVLLQRSASDRAYRKLRSARFYQRMVEQGNIIKW